MKIAAIAGSNANHSYNRMLLKFIAAQYQNTDDIDVIDIRKVPMFNENYRGKTPQIITDLNRRIKTADAVIIASPEYNHSITSALKSVVEWLSYKVHPLENKPVLIVGASTHEQGSSRSQVQLRDILISPGVNAQVYQGNEFFMSDAANVIDENGQITDQATVGFLEKCIDDFKIYARAINKMVTDQVAAAKQGPKEAAKDK
ncbi:NADPH-dependent FMN reductase [Limosilactobacillus sp.]|uniref:NADPH-dependent FMN reductase n=1 Tax=Limosilactobacillus sp. TaxID=2773925 RepID=UPI0035A1849A